MNEYGIELGDTIRLYMLESLLADKEPEFDYLVVGSYVREGIKDNIYCQLGQYLGLDYLYNYEGEDNRALFRYTVITSDSIHYTKLYDAGVRPDAHNL